MKRSFKRNINAVNDIFDFTAAFVDSSKIDEATSFAMNLAIEELFTNIVKYSTGGGEKISIHLNIQRGNLVVKITDFDVEPFDISHAGEVDVTKSLDERGIGGIGLHLVRNVVDKITYEYKDRNACITLTKHLEDSNV